ncbi:hypothetical protein BT96DRAFT_991423 [Gymnopus androsaceus JB14]|uniref:Uncharacterized protein n=1 Tax=Gymnopus androsaceus JB14 TaxID=1447944 RepID=A0A6A4HW17_9AGAR|nr:hypothetical protein BT96DRAFT_991423 [Gymnopus androsaceus JB14]
MANTLLKLKGTLELRARIYTPRQKSPEYIHVLTRTTSPRSSQRYALVDSLFEAQTFQPHTHDIFVSVKHGRATDTFRVFFKRSTRLAHNTNFGVRGDVVIMRSAKNARHSVVNFRGASDARLADYVLKQISPKILQFQGPLRHRCPKQIILLKRRVGSTSIVFYK